MAAAPLLITMGDPAGVGPELALQGAMWASRSRIPVALVGSAGVFRRVAARLSLDLWPVHPITTGLDAVDAEGPWIYDLPTFSASSVVPGRVDKETGKISLECVQWAISQAMAGQAKGVVTGPIHKAAWHAAGCPFPGHTELLAERCGVPRHCMMLAGRGIRCALVTVHIGFTDIVAALSPKLIRETIELSGAAVETMLGRRPRITVLGLNPHAGEGGLFGNREEELLIAPAIEQARAEGWNVRGPLPPDTAFIPALREETDLYVCMYHDQGLIPLKALAFDEAVNITLGLPIVRTSVDHGTALDLAWQGKASTSSMLAAIELAWKLSQESPRKK